MAAPNAPAIGLAGDTRGRARVALLTALAAAALALSAGPARSEVAGLERLGAEALVERVIDARQRQSAIGSAAWTDLEIDRIEWLIARRAWRAVLERRSAYPEALETRLRIAADEAGAEAHRALGDPESALRILDGLLALPVGTVSARARWSRLQVRALLEAGDAEGARGALARYREAHPADGDGAALLEARLLLLDGHLEEVLLFLDGVEGTEAALVRLAAVADARQADPRGFLAAAGKVTDVAGASAAERHQAWALVARVARDRRDPDLEAVALENALAQPPGQAPGLLARADGDALWAAYEALARRAANERQLLVGRYDDWLVLGAERAADDPVAARALLAFVARRADREAVREAAGLRYAELVGAEPEGRRAAAVLWTASRTVDGLEAIPESVRPVLIIDLVAAGRYEAAGALAPDAPASAVPASALWRPAYAHALARIGLAGAAVETLLPALAPGVEAPTPLWHACVATLAELLAGSATEEAGRLIDALARTEVDARRAAVLVFHRGELHAVGGEHAQAASAYLEAALGLAGEDARVARRLAAGAAARAGLAADAAGIRAALAAESGSDGLPALRAEPFR